MTTATAPAPTREYPLIEPAIVKDRLAGLIEHVSEDGTDIEEPTEAMFDLWRAIRVIAAGAARCSAEDVAAITDECADLVLDVIARRLSGEAAA